MQSTDGVMHKCLYRLPSGKIIVRRNGQVIGSYCTERLAALALADHMGVDVRDLKRRETRQTTQQAPPMVRGVYGARGGKFEVRVDGQYHGRFDSAASASKHAAKIGG